MNFHVSFLETTLKKCFADIGYRKRCTVEGSHETFRYRSEIDDFDKGIVFMALYDSHRLRQNEKHFGRSF